MPMPTVLNLKLTAGQRRDSPQFALVLDQISVPRLGPDRHKSSPRKVLADKPSRHWP
ncbi:hypothetical protein [Glycomyces sp. YM15]|uniref:hypothetical protein n=1 Tax=Glycomyces sp. YM15 TaxID=2800446 RepID=UPI001965FB41|nr:hypothetical protein [Glycomyces sp. YM15]